MPLPSESIITAILHTGDVKMSNLNLTPFDFNCVTRKSRSLTSKAILPPALALGCFSFANVVIAKHPPPGRSYSTQAPFAEIYLVPNLNFFHKNF